MGNGSVGSAGGAFDPQLWQAAQQVVTDGASLGETALTDTRLRQLTAIARKDATITEGERALLETLADPQAGSAIYQRLRGHESVPAAAEVQFAPSPQARRQVSGLVAQAEAAEAIHVRGLDLEEVDLKDLRRLAAGTGLGAGAEGDLATEAGRLTALDRFGQLMIADQDVAPNACSATAMTALAMSRGADGLRTLARAAMADETTHAAASRFLARLDSGDADLTLTDVSDFVEGLYQGWQAQDADGDSGIRNRTVSSFLDRHQDDLGRLFATGARLAAVDTDGDLAQDHFVAFIPMADGTLAVFDPWQQADDHHLVTDAERVDQYQQVTAATFRSAPVPDAPRPAAAGE